ncbi:MAG: hypothetical protein ACI8RZ_004589 [Myxococcota bacterium]|jgi:uncharacterized protein (UPF0276 family)
MGFVERAQNLPTLGLGVSTEYGAADAPGALDLRALRRAAPRLGAFLEVGVEVAKGLDGQATRWAGAGLPTTYHFLDVNLDEPEDLDASWLEDVRRLVGILKPAWMCGDAGLWHFGPRDRSHMLLLPPILTDASATELADGITALRGAVGLEILPENPPGTIFIGDLPLLDFFATVLERADTGMLLDCAHLAMYQRLMGRQPTDGLDGFPLDRIIELHIAGGSTRSRGGFTWVEDDHSATILPETWAIFRYIAARAENLKAVVVECERNPLPVCLPMMRQTAAVLRDSALSGAL